MVKCEAVKILNYESTGYKVFKVFNIMFMLLIMVVMLFPYLNVIAKAFNDGGDTALGGITIFPREFTLVNFKTLLQNSQIVLAAGVSVARVICAVVISLLVQFLAAYGFTKKNLWGRSQLLMFLTIPMFFGGGLIPIYILYAKIGFLNNFMVYIIPHAFNLYNMIIIRTYINTIPVSLEESAKLDGANEFTVFFRIILPLSMPIVATIALWTAVGQWNDWTTTLYFMTKPKLYTLQYILMQVLKETERITKLVQEAALEGREMHVEIKATPESLQSAQIVLTTIPIILVYPFLQKYFIKGVTVGAIKD
jgi:putative aldouronate transport system permease protein